MRDRVKVAAAHNPPEFELHRPWTAEEEEASGFTLLRSSKQKAVLAVNVNKQEVEHIHAVYVSPEENHKAGLFSDMFELQKYLLEPKWQKDAIAAEKNPSEHIARRGNTVDMTFSQEPGHHAAGTHLSMSSQQGSPEHQRMVQCMIRTATAILTQHVTATTGQQSKIRWAVNASITAGNEDNLWLTSIQVNCSKLQEKDTKTLKLKGHKHFDKNDVPTQWTVILFLPHYPDNYYPGYLAVYSTQVCCRCDRFGALVFTGRHLHGGVGRGYHPDGYVSPPLVPGQSKLVYPKVPDHLPHARIHVTAYPRMELMNPAVDALDPLLYTPMALSAFGTARNWAEFKLRYFLKQNIEVITQDPIYWCEKFSWVENGVTYYPRRWIAEMCFQFAQYGWLDIPEVGKLHKALLSSGLVVSCPQENRTIYHDEPRGFVPSVCQE